MQITSMLNPLRGQSSKPPAVEVRFAGQTFIVIEGLTNRVQPAQRRKAHVGKSALDLRHPAFNGAVDSRRHFGRDEVNELAMDRCTGQSYTHLSRLFAATASGCAGCPSTTAPKRANPPY